MELFEVVRVGRCWNRVEVCLFACSFQLFCNGNSQGKCTWIKLSKFNISF